MIFGIFGKTKPPPLTAFCKKLDDPATLVRVANNMVVDRSAEFAELNKRAVLLSSIAMGAAGHLVDKILDRGEPGQRVLRETNLDVITAEAIVWIHFLMSRFWETDQKKSPEMLERVDDSTFVEALQFVLQNIGEQTGFDFKETTIERVKFYSEAIKDRNVSFEPFATIVFRSIGRQSLAEPLKALEAPPLTLDWTYLTMQVGIFFSTMPLACYETFKNFMKEWPDDDFDKDSKNEFAPKPRTDSAHAHPTPKDLLIARTPPWDRVHPAVINAILDAITDKALLDVFVTSSMNQNLVPQYEQIDTNKNSTVIRLQISHILCLAGRPVIASLTEAV